MGYELDRRGHMGKEDWSWEPIERDKGFLREEKLASDPMLVIHLKCHRQNPSRVTE